MAAAQTKTAKVGDLIDVAEDSQVERPDGTRNTVTGGVYVLDVPGTYIVDGAEVTAK